jgi:ABC-type lipoprotein release transport system permease subunit
VRAVLLVVAARFRRGWRAWLLLSLLVALVSGVAMAAATAGRRAATAFPRFVAEHGFDATVYSVRPLPGLTGLPEVRQVIPGALPFGGSVTCDCPRPLDQANLTLRILPGPGALGEVVKLVSGRMPAGPGEVLASYNLAEDGNVRIGTVLRTRFYAASQRRAVLAGLTPAPAPAGTSATLRVTGIAAAEAEFPSGPSPSLEFYLSPEFATAYPGVPTLQIYYVRLRHGAADLGRFEGENGVLKGAGVLDLDRPAAAIATSIRPQATGWWVLAGLAALAGLAVTGQALARQAAAEDSDDPMLAALGLRPAQLVAASLARSLAAGVAGAVAGASLAVALSLFTPAGEARLADPSAGLLADWPVLATGALLTVLVTAALGVLPALRSARGRARLRARPGLAPGYRLSVTVHALASAGAPPAAIIGTRRALQRGRPAGPDSGAGPGGTVPVGTALAGTVTAVAALCATAVFGASLAHLTASPELYGAPFQLFFVTSGPGTGSTEKGLLAEFRRDPGLARITLARAPSLTVNRVVVSGLATQVIRGPALLSVAAGRLPAGDREIALGASTMRQTGARLGGTVRVTLRSPAGYRRTVPFTVTGIVPFASDLTTGGIGTGAALTLAGYDGALCPPGPGAAACRHTAERGLGSVILLRAADGPAGAAALARHIHRHPYDAYRTAVPTALVSFGESANFPLLLGAILVLCGAASLAHLLAVSVRRRRRENGLLSSLGFVRRQLGEILFWQASTVAVAGLLAGMPLGLVAGHAIWRAFAANLGVVGVVVLPAGVIALLGAGVLVAANLLAVLPALAAGRSPAGPALRSE